MNKILNKLRKALFKLSDIDRIIQQSVRDNNKQIDDMLTKHRYEQLSLVSDRIGISDEQYGPHELIVSLTTYGNRINEVYLAIESLMQQTMKPNRIIIWLDETEFCIDNIPLSLKKLINRGLTISFCEDLRSYKKLIPTLQTFPKAIIITCDDDLIYKPDLIENLYRAYIKNSDAVIFGGGHEMKIEGGMLMTYNSWYNPQQVPIYSNPLLNFPGGGTGTLYPPQVLHPDVTKKELFLQLAPTADDVWFKAMSLLTNTPCIKAYTHDKLGNDFVELGTWTQKTSALMTENVFNNKNDIQIKAVFDYYNLYEKIGCKKK